LPEADSSAHQLLQQQQPKMLNNQLVPLMVSDSLVSKSLNETKNEYLLERRSRETEPKWVNDSGSCLYIRVSPFVPKLIYTDVCSHFVT
jgi:hypothetical protein